LFTGRAAGAAPTGGARRQRVLGVVGVVAGVQLGGAGEQRGGLLEAAALGVRLAAEVPTLPVVRTQRAGLRGVGGHAVPLAQGGTADGAVAPPPVEVGAQLDGVRQVVDGLLVAAAVGLVDAAVGPDHRVLRRALECLGQVGDGLVPAAQVGAGVA